MNALLGLDLGGTNIKISVLERDENGYRVVWADQRDTEAARGPDGVARNLAEAAREGMARFPKIERIGLGVPGLFQRETGEIVLFPNLPGAWSGFPLRSTMEASLGLEVRMINDARAFTLAEGTLGAGAGFRCVACIALGTGVGGGIIIDGKLHLGAFGVAGELGHQTIDPTGPRCGCGNRGCVEAMARSGVLVEMAGKETVEEVFREARAGDERSLSAIERVAGIIGIGLANVVTLIGPDRIVVGGGIAQAGDLVIDPIRRAIRERVTLVPAELIEVVPATLGTWAGAHGAAIAGEVRL